MKAAAAVAALDDYTIDYIHRQMPIQLTMYTMYIATYTIVHYVHSWPTINIRPHIMHFRRLVFSYTE